MNITYFHNARDTTASPASGDWADIVAFIAEAMAIERRRDDKLDAPAIIAGMCEGRRANANVRHLSFLAADFDIGPDDPRYLSFNARCDRLDTQGYAFVAYTTTANDRAHNRYRLIMPLGMDVLPEHWLAVWEACNDKFDGAIDKATKDPARLSFLPAKWVGNPFFDKGKNKTVALADPFNDMRQSVEGKPILTAEEIDALALINFDAEPSPPDIRHSSNRPATPRAQANSYAIIGALTAAERDTLARGAKSDSCCWAYIGKLETSPLVTRWMCETLPNAPGSRDHRFCLYAARNAVQHSIPITTDILAGLAAEWSEIHLSRPAPADIARQAENALTWAIRAPKEQPPETAIQPEKESEMNYGKQPIERNHDNIQRYESQ